MTGDSAFSFPEDPVTSPTLPANEGFVYTPKQFSDALTLDLTDGEIQQALGIIVNTSKKWRTRFAYKSLTGFHDVEEAMKLVDQFESELKTRLADIDLLATVDVMPVFEGQPPIVELVGALPGHPSEKYGLDHEKKTWEVKKAKALGQDFLGSDHID